MSTDRAGRPNIILIMTDQQFAGAMSCAGNSDLHTPNLDRLARMGVRFENAYCAHPLCTPSRAATFTGRMPHQVGITQNGQSIAEQFREQELGHLLSDAGYQCAYAGKWHVPEISMPEGHGFTTICGFDDVNLPAAVEGFLDGRDSRTPFFLVASFDNPHNICEWRRDQNVPWGEIGPPPAPEACPMLPANFEIPPYEPEIIRTATMANRRIYPDDRYTPDQWRRYRWAYYRLTELADRQIGLVLDALDARGLLQDSVIVFMSDHGDGHGAHRLVQKTFLYEESTRVPFIVAAPDITKKGKVDNESLISSCLDGFATICDYAGVDLPEGVTRPDGPISLRQAVSGTAAPVSRRYIAAETELQQAAYSGRMIRTNRYKYCAWQWGAYREQLFDLERDPGEMVNLAVSTSHRQILQDHRDLLREWCEVTADQFYGHHYSHPAVPFMVPGDSYPQEA